MQSEPLASKPGNPSKTYIGKTKENAASPPPRPPQEWPSAHQGALRAPKGGPGDLQGCYGTPQERSKASSGLPRNAPRAPREPPRAIRETPRAIQEPPTALRELQRCSKSAPEQRLRSKTRRRFDSSLRFWRESESSSERDKRAALCTNQETRSRSKPERARERSSERARELASERARERKSARAREQERERAGERESERARERESE